MAKNSRVPSAVGAIPVVGDLMKQADTQAQWVQDLLEQNARLVGQLPATIKTFNDSLERFNQTVGRLDRMVTQVETATNQLINPMGDLLRTTTDTQKQLALLTSTVERIMGILDGLPGAGIVRRFTGGRPDEPSD